MEFLRKMKQRDEICEWRDVIPLNKGADHNSTINYFEKFEFYFYNKFNVRIWRWTKLCFVQLKFEPTSFIIEHNNI